MIINDFELAAKSTALISTHPSTNVSDPFLLNYLVKCCEILFKSAAYNDRVDGIITTNVNILMDILFVPLGNVKDFFNNICSRKVN